ncbi:ATP/GTP-binding protein [Streptomyces sp. NPDC059096]|uniref:GTP-binding protein n=1 Tax=Streptomyces sp. NPDC059096 TaxID=3346727 RepID=UPI0036BB486E
MKIVIAGPFGVGKTTMVGATTQIEPLRTEETLTQAGTGVDDISGVRDKTTTTVAIDFGRLDLPSPDPSRHPGAILYLFGAPGQDRYRTLWNEITYGALGILVLADTRRLQASFEVLDWVETRGLPYSVALNLFDDSPDHSVTEVRTALDLDASTPLTVCDARDSASARHALIALVEHIQNRVLTS